MGIFYSTDQDVDYYNTDVDFEHLGVKHRHPFDIPVPTDDTFFYKDHMHIDYKDYGFTILNKNIFI